jgi:hypothetical protein
LLRIEGVINQKENAVKRRDFLIGTSMLTGLAFSTRALALQETPMRKLTVFNNVSLDGYFTDSSGDMSWAHKQDPEWAAFTAENAGGEAELLFGRVTYEMMASFWPTPQALQNRTDSRGRDESNAQERVLANA